MALEGRRKREIKALASVTTGMNGVEAVHGGLRSGEECTGMAICFALVAIVVGSALFHFLSPWRITPIASNWREMDDTLAVTFITTAIFFVAINLLVAYTVYRFRHRPGHRAAYQPDNKKLERWLIVTTSLAIIGLLAPGLFVYAKYVRPPAEALQLEVLGQQWQWRYRFPGTSGRLGRSSASLVNAMNPFGLDPGDPAGQDNILVNNNEVHLPLDRPVKVFLRSHDVLHDFYVPQFRARMNMVPGMVTSFWFTPTKAGRYEVLCAQLCGVGHFSMRGIVVVEDEARFQAWLQQQPTYAAALAPQAGTPATGDSAGNLLAAGQALAQSKGCTACHSVDGSNGVGPTWKGLYGKRETLADGSAVAVDAAYLQKSIREPTAQVVKGYPPIMPRADVSDEELAALLAYIKSMGAKPGTQQGTGK
jgi:cytochrome c oxidase subunit 2